MATIDHDLAQPVAQPISSPATSGWGNSAPLGLAAFAVTTFMLSMVNAESHDRRSSRSSSGSP